MPHINAVIVSKNKNKSQNQTVINSIAIEQLNNNMRVLLESYELPSETKDALTNIFTLLVKQYERQEIELTTIKSSIIIETPQTQSLITELNNLNEQLAAHSYMQPIAQLAEKLIVALRTHCNALTPLASGFYKPHNASTIIGEATHESNHFFGHFAHYVAHETPKFSKYASAIGHAVPVIGSLVTLLEIYNDHNLIHNAEHAVKKLSNYSDNQRDVIYKYVVTKMLHVLAPNIENKPLVHWFELLLNQSLSCLPALHDSAHIDELAQNWSQLIIKKIKLGVSMPTETPMTKVTFTKAEVSVVLAVQKVFKEPILNNSHLTLPKKMFLEEFHRRIYDEVLEPYDGPVNGWNITAYFRLYSYNDLTQLRAYQSCFNQALKIIQEQLYPIKNLPDANYELQLNLINTCLYSHINNMAQAMQWHKLASSFYLKEASQTLSYTPAPLIENRDGTLSIISLEGLLASTQISASRANARVDELEKDIKEIKDALSMNGREPAPSIAPNSKFFVGVKENSEAKQGLASSESKNTSSNNSRPSI